MCSENIQSIQAKQTLLIDHVIDNHPATCDLNKYGYCAIAESRDDANPYQHI